jgi:hypothetical protein
MPWEQTEAPSFRRILNGTTKATSEVVGKSKRRQSRSASASLEEMVYVSIWPPPGDFCSNFTTPKLSQSPNSKPMKQVKLTKISLTCLALAVLCGVVQAQPVILTEPVSQTAPPGNTVSFTVSALDATGYQWQAGAPGSGVYTNLLNAGEFSGVTTTNLIITGATPDDNMDIIVVVSNGSGSVTSAPPANLTVAGLIYFESFNMPTIPDQTVNHVGWMNDVTGEPYYRIFSNNHGVTYPRCAVFSYNSGGANEAFYGTVSTITGGPYPASPYPITNKMAFPGINLSVAQNVSFSVAMNTFSAPASQSGFICVQINFGNWYVSTNGMQATGLSFVTNSYVFNPTASAWKQLTVSGVGSDSTSLVPVIGSLATNDLSGYITGVGLVVTHAGGTTLQFNNYSIVAAIPPYPPCPIIYSPPASTTNYSGTTATFSVSAYSYDGYSILSYQWQTNTAVGSTTWANVLNGSKFSGVTTATLSVSNVNAAADHKDYRVIVSNAVCQTISGPPNGPEATLTVMDAGPIPPEIAATIYPNDANLFSSSDVTIEAGNNNTLNFTAPPFTGSQPISYQWQVSPNPDGSGAVNIPGATNTTYTLSNPQVSNTGYYSLQASNSFSGSTPATSTWVQLTVLPSTNSVIKWSAPMAINGLTAAQILSPYGTYFEAELFNGAAVNGGVDVTVTNGTTVFTFDNTGASASLSCILRGVTGPYGPGTGDPNFDLVLGTDDEVYSCATITLSNLTVGQLYTVQIFALIDNTGSTRQVNFSVPTDNNDVSASFMFGDNVYVVGTFIATATTQQISMGQAGGNGYISSVIVRTLTGPPSPAIQQSGSNLQVNWGIGTLLQATNLTGPWITNTAPTPLTVAPTGSKMFFRVQFP